MTPLDRQMTLVAASFSQKQDALMKNSIFKYLFSDMPVKRDDASTALAILKRLSEESPKGTIMTSILTRQFRYLDILIISVFYLYS